MSLNEVDKIKSILSEVGANPVYSEHEAVRTSEDAVRVRGGKLSQGIKAILFTTETDWVVVDIPADKKVDVGKVARHLGWSRGRLRMATPDEVLQKTGCEVGAVPPFGHKENLKILVDEGVFDNQENSFNIGLRTHSAKVRTEDVRRVFDRIGAFVGEFSC
ncbi:MAG: hypothetical protein KJ905_03515 [Nanoarchaeota archaeon]|nr:hypothetical protein [Nanoarchaeota archaeon]MBU1501811.1 hypothetical protein [Nanoarchaeota archaeon]MBU2459415.1 hypothetical protein [Nanoarchaeota archaeon]